MDEKHDARGEQVDGPSEPRNHGVHAGGATTDSNADLYAPKRGGAQQVQDNWPDPEKTNSHYDHSHDHASHQEPEESPSPTCSNGNGGEDPEKPAERTLTQTSSLRRTPSLNRMVSLPREILVVGILCLSQFTTQISFGNTLSILHIIGRDFGITDPGIESWLIAGYSLTVGSFILVSGRLGDMFGYKRMLIIGYSWFALWSLVAGLAAYSNYVLFIWARVLSGMGPSIALTNGLALLGLLYEPGMRKNLSFAMFGALAPGGSICGSAFGALFAQLAWWPWTFWSNAIALAVIAAVAYFIVPDPQVKPKLPTSLKTYIVELDLLAAAVGITALVLFNFAWNQAPIVGWKSPYVCVCLVLGVLLFPTFFYLEIRVSKNPLIPFTVLTSTNAFVLGCVACGWANFGIWVYYFWQIIEVLRGVTPLLGSAYLSPLVITGFLAAFSTGYLLGKLRPAWLMVMAMSAFLMGNLLIATVPPHQIYWGQLFVTTLIAPFGMDMSFPAATLYLSNSIEKERQGVAASLVNTIVNYSISLGLGFAGTVETHVNNGATTPEDTLKGYRGALYMGTGLAGFGLALSIVFLLKTYRDDRKVLSKPADPESESPDRG